MEDNYKEIIYMNKPIKILQYLSESNFDFNKRIEFIKTLEDKIKTLTFIRPNAEFIVRGDELEWLDKKQDKPTEAEIEAGWIAYQAAKTSEAETNAIAKSALLERLGISQAEANLLLN